MTLTEFLMARIADDERDATWEPSHEWDAVTVAEWAGKSPGNLAVQHAGRWSPARVLAECDAKRKAVEMFGPMSSQGDSAGAAAEWALLFLALPYADHPDYQREWKP